jgi:hypothetical protein
LNSAVLCVLKPCSPETLRCFVGTYTFHVQDRNVRHARNQKKQATSWAYFSILKKKAICSSETSIEFYRTTQRCNLQGRTRYGHGCKNLQSSVSSLVLSFYFLSSVFVIFPKSDKRLFCGQI